MKNLTEEEIKHLEWIYHRMIKVHGENENVDYMLKMGDILNIQPEYLKAIEDNTAKRIDKLIDDINCISIGEHRFEKPDFECELLKVVDNGKLIRLVGYLIDPSDKSIISGHWDLDGNFFSGRMRFNKFNIKPLKKPWYEDKNNFPTLITTDTGNKTLVINHITEISSGWLEVCPRISYSVENLRLATKGEIDGLYHA